MNTLLSKSALFSLGLLLSAQLHAQDAEEPIDEAESDPEAEELEVDEEAGNGGLISQVRDTLRGSISIGYVGTSGNAATDTYNSEIRGTWDTTNWSHNFKFQGLGARREGEVTAERYFLEGKSDFNLDERHYLFAGGNFNNDRFSGFNYQASSNVGYGRYLVRTEAFTLESYLGGGYRYSESSLGESEGEGVVTLGQELEWQITSTASLYQNFRSEIGNDLTVTVFEAGLESTILFNIATRIAFQARHNSAVPEGRVRLDTQTSVNMVYRF